ncbi:hypothetical protein TNCV_379041 [Trichonephila clavipes]|nr:hypothetical protein TNCV_379041 [Trichonephila clavipes]
MAPKELSELTMLSRRKSHLLGQITHIKNSLESVDLPLNQVGFKKKKLASLSKVKAKIDIFQNKSYSILLDEELKNFEDSLDRMEEDTGNLEASLNTLLQPSNMNTSKLSVKNDYSNCNV